MIKCKDIRVESEEKEDEYMIKEEIMKEIEKNKNMRVKIIGEFYKQEYDVKERDEDYIKKKIEDNDMEIINVSEYIEKRIKEKENEIKEAYNKKMKYINIRISSNDMSINLKEVHKKQQIYL